MKKKKSVLDDGAADRAAELLLLVDGLGEQEGRGSVVERLVLAVGVERVQVGITQVVEDVAMELVRAALGDGVDLAAGGLAELDRVVRGLGLELLDGVDRVDVRRARCAAAGLGEQHLVVVRAVDVVLVVEAADAMEADEAGAAVLRDVRRVQNEGAPVAGGDGQIGDQLLAEGLRDFGLLGVEDRGLAGDVDFSGDGRSGQRGVDGEDLADGEHEILAVDLAEAGAAESDLIVAGLQGRWRCRRRRRWS